MTAIRAFFGSIVLKQGLILLVMGGATAASVAIGLMVFSTLTTSVVNLKNSVVPEIESSLEVIERTDKVRDAIGAIALASDAVALAAAEATFERNMERLTDATIGLPDQAARDIEPRIAALEASIAREFTARSERFEARSKLDDQLNELQEVSAAAKGKLNALLGRAFGDLSSGGDETIDLVRGTLEGLTAREFALLQAVLEFRGELNLATAAMLAVSQTEDAAFRGALEAVALEAFSRAELGFEVLEGNAAVTRQLGPALETMQFLQNAQAQDFNFGFLERTQLLSLRKASDASMAELVDRMTASLQILSEDASTQTESFIRSLIDTEVDAIISSGQIATAVNGVLVAALLGATASDAATLQDAQDTLSLAFDDLNTIVAQGDNGASLGDLLLQIEALADPMTGVLSARRAYLAALEVSLERSREATS
ncbi:MAG: hypothetical protein AAFN59_08080, partial [Pseudomonadota bacterium]